MAKSREKYKYRSEQRYCETGRHWCHKNAFLSTQYAICKPCQGKVTERMALYRGKLQRWCEGGHRATNDMFSTARHSRCSWCTQRPDPNRRIDERAGLPTRAQFSITRVRYEPYWVNGVRYEKRILYTETVTE